MVNNNLILCEEVLKNNGDIRFVNCCEIECEDCPFSSNNNFYNTTCCGRDYKSNIEIAKNYIKEHDKDYFIRKADNVNEPTHYKTKSYECRKVMDELIETITDGKEAYNYGNIFKYIWRYKKKNGIEDLKKAKNYLDDLIKYLEDKNN